jgi:hypothetical protein
VRGPVGRLAPRPRTPLLSGLGSLYGVVARWLGAEYFAHYPHVLHCAEAKGGAGMLASRGA